MKKVVTQHEHFLSMHKDYEWIVRNIEGSSTPMQMEACDRLIDLFKERYKKESIPFRNMLISVWLKRKEEIRIELHQIEWRYNEYNKDNAEQEEDTTEDHR